MGADAGTDTIERGKLDAVICRETADKEFVDVPIPQIFGQAGRAFSAIIEKAAVAVDSRINSFSKNVAKAFRAKLGGESRSGRSLDAMDRPQNLPNPIQINHLAWPPVWMVGGKAPMICRVPILGGQNERETFH